MKANDIIQSITKWEERYTTQILKKIYRLLPSYTKIIEQKNIRFTDHQQLLRNI